MSRIVVNKHTNFISVFYPETGQYIRTGVIREEKDTGEDPFMAPFPELLDVGIMGHCIHGKRGLCVKASVQCYQDGLHSVKENMSLCDFEFIAKQCSKRTFQFALGGCGDPDQHENFREILEICRHYRIVPNFTTSGLGMTKAIAKLCRDHCGAVAVSWYRSEYTLNAIKMLADAGVKTNIHYVLSRSTIDEAIERFKKSLFPKEINAIVLLLHKPVGLGTKEEVLSITDSRFKELIKLVTDKGCGYKIGFDSCSVPALMDYLEEIDVSSIDTCEGARWSAYITSDMKMLPCSFDNQEQRWAVDLREFSIQEAWNSTAFENFRDHFKNACPECPNRGLCMGGCPICPEVVPCERLNGNLSVAHGNPCRVV